VIYFITRAHHSYTVGNYLHTWGLGLAPRIQLLPYETLFGLHDTGTGTYIFCDLDRLTRSETAVAIRIWNCLNQARPAVRLLNHPGRPLLRYELLKTLHAQGINRFQLFPLNEKRKVSRFPVFIRRAEHDGSRTPLLETPQKLDQAVAKLLSLGESPSHLFIVEYCPTQDSAGIFRKYSAFFINGEVIPRHLIFSREWMLKLPDLIDPEKLREERAYLESNPHRDWIAKIFRLAQIDYGRIDYGLSDGIPQVWEINTNPIIMLRPERYQLEHLENQKFFAEKIEKAFSAVDHSEKNSHPIKIVIPFRLMLSVRLERLFRKIAWRLQFLIRRIARGAKSS
jgi:hypothetical protein